MKQLFTIYKLLPEGVKIIHENPNEPHKHEDYEEVIVGMKGKIEHFIDFQSQVLEAPFVTFVSKGKVHRLQPNLLNGECDMWVIRFKSEFISETIFQLYRYYHNSANIQLESDFCFNRMNLLCEMMHEEYIQEEPDFSIIRNLLQTLFSMIEHERKRLKIDDEQDFLNSQSVTFRNFLRILEDNFRRSEGVEFYAEKLFMSSRNLNKISQNIMQQSVSELIETRKLLEAKNLLITTDKTIAEIGFELGYNEKSYFTNVFKKKTGMTPSDFRKEMKNLIS